MASKIETPSVDKYLKKLSRVTSVNKSGKQHKSPLIEVDMFKHRKQEVLEASIPVKHIIRNPSYFDGKQHLDPDKDIIVDNKLRLKVTIRDNINKNIPKLDEVTGLPIRRKNSEILADRRRLNNDRSRREIATTVASTTPAPSTNSLIDTTGIGDVVSSVVDTVTDAGKSLVDKGKEMASNVVNAVDKKASDFLSGEQNDAKTSDDAKKAVNASEIMVEGNARTVLGDLSGEAEMEARIRISKDIILLDNLTMIGGMAPLGDNVTDPPVTALGDDSGAKNKPLKGFSSGFCGMDYMERCISDTQFLVLVPFTIKPSPTGNLFPSMGGGKKNWTSIFSNNIESRLTIGSYGLNVEFASRRYWRTHSLLLKAASISLGIELELTPGEKGRISTEQKEKQLRAKLPDHIYDALFGDATNGSFNFENATGKPGSEGNVSPKDGQVIDTSDQFTSKTETTSAATSDEVTAANLSTSAAPPIDPPIVVKDEEGNIIDKAITVVSDAYASGLDSVGRLAGSAAGALFGSNAEAAVYGGITSFGSKLLPEEETYPNGMKKTIDAATGEVSVSEPEVIAVDSYMTNASEQEKQANSSLRASGYSNLLKYMANVDGGTIKAHTPIVTFAINGSVSRSLATSINTGDSATAQVMMDHVKKAMEGTDITSGVMDNANEVTFHGASGANAIDNLLSTTSLPKVMSGVSQNFSYTVKITEKVIGSDPYSLLRVMDTYAKLVPFYTPVSNGKSGTVVPNAPMYCSAFVKGVMNLSRAMITQVNITTHPMFQTSEGIPTEIDLEIVIEPMLSVSAMPDFGRFFVQTDIYTLVASMYNPLSPFNIIATMCGFNTVLSTYPYSLFDFFVTGKVTSLLNSFKGSGSFVTDSMYDRVSSWKQNIATNVAEKTV